MYLAEVHIDNFRSIDELDIHFSQGLNVIVGENNIGKSSIIDAIRIALGGSGATGNDSLWINIDDFRRISFNKSEPKIRVDLFFSGLSSEDMGLFVEALNYNKEKPKESTVSIHFEAIWNENSNRATIKRWGGNRERTKASIDDEALATLRWTYLEPLRDAASALAPGRNSRIVKLLTAFKTKDDIEEIERLFFDANAKLLKNDTVQKAHESLSNHLNKKLGKQLTPGTSIQASEYNFDKIIRTMRLVLKGPYFKEEGSGEKVFEHFSLETNGLGYNNLIYIAAVLAELESSESANHRLLLVEEPEAHLHPQLQTKLANYLSKLSVSSKSMIVPPNEDDKKAEKENEDDNPVQVIVTSHSPTISSHVRPDQLRIFHKTSNSCLKVGDISRVGTKPDDLAAIQRLLDVTKGAMCFARGIIFVEGVTEQLLVPVFANKLGYNLDDYGVSVIPVHGVDFNTLLPFFGDSDNEVDIPVSIVTDRDPKKLMSDGTVWKGTASKRGEVKPERNKDGHIIPCDRIVKLKKAIKDKHNVKLCCSFVTLEYNLAGPSKRNVELMAEVWESFYSGTPGFSLAMAKKIKDCNSTRALIAWREICLSQATVKKSEFAHQLAYMISNGKDFDVPSYIKKAITHACGVSIDE